MVYSLQILHGSKKEGRTACASPYATSKIYHQLTWQGAKLLASVSA